MDEWNLVDCFPLYVAVQGKQASFDKAGGTWPLIMFAAKLKYVSLVKFPSHGGSFPCTWLSKILNVVIVVRFANEEGTRPEI